MNEISWVLPLLLLPGVALLIVSTSARYTRLHDEVHALNHDGTVVSEQIVRHLLVRATYFRNALVSLYLCVAIFALTSIIGAVISLTLAESAAWVVFALTCGGVFFLIVAAGLLVREASLSLEIIREHFHHLIRENHEKFK